MSRYTRNQRPMKLERIVELCRAGKLSRERAEGAVRRLAQSDGETMAVIEAERRRLEQERPGLRVSMSRVVNVLVQRGARLALSVQPGEAA